MENVKQTIKSLGGVTAVAKLCDVTPQAVSQWCAKNKIPKTTAILLRILIDKKGA